LDPVNFREMWIIAARRTRQPLLIRGPCFWWARAFSSLYGQHAHSTTCFVCSNLSNWTCLTGRNKKQRKKAMNERRRMHAPLRCPFRFLIWGLPWSFSTWNLWTTYFLFSVLLRIKSLIFFCWSGNTWAALSPLDVSGKIK